MPHNIPIGKETGVDFTASYDAIQTTRIAYFSLPDFRSPRKTPGHISTDLSQKPFDEKIPGQRGHGGHGRQGGWTAMIECQVE
jgi:hypothetical protein